MLIFKNNKISLCLNFLRLLVFTVAAEGVAEANDIYRASNLASYNTCRREKRAIVVGSSVSLGLFGDSPSVYYLERAGYKRRCIKKKNLPLGHSQILIKWVRQTVEEFKPDFILAMDYLIHDVTFVHAAEKVPEELAQTNDTIDYLASTGIPVAVGTVFTPRPLKYPFAVDMARDVNRKLCATARQYPATFFVLPTALIYQELYADRFILPGYHRPLRLREVLVDMYHPGPRGARMLANRSIDYLNALHDSPRQFPLHAKPYSLKRIFRTPRTRPILQAVNTLAHEKTILGDAEDTFLIVNETTIPDDIVEPGCLEIPGQVPAAATPVPISTPTEQGPEEASN